MKVAPRPRSSASAFDHELEKRNLIGRCHRIGVAPVDFELAVGVFVIVLDKRRNPAR
jgi:hypothetical protein